MSSLFKALVRIEKAVIGIFLAIAVIVIMISVIGRRIGHAPAWSEEAVRYLVIWITFLGSGICFRRGTHYGVDVIRRVNQPLIQKAVSVFVIIVSTVFVAFLIIFGTKYTLFTMRAGQKTAALGWPIWIVYLSVPVGGVLALLHLAEVFCSEVLGIYQIKE